MTTSREREPESITPKQIRDASEELVVLVRNRLPERFYPSEPAWRITLTAFVARIAALLESMARLADSRRQGDVLVLVRALYEHAVTFMWIAIDPKPRVRDWAGDSMIHKKALHHDAALFGAENVMSEEELRRAAEAEKLQPLEQRASEVDDYWAPRIHGFHLNPPEGPRNILTIRGLYTVLYRLGSRSAHATLESVDPWLRDDGAGRYSVHVEPRDGGLFWSSLALPVSAMALVVAHERLGWPDEEQVRAINEALMHEEVDSDP